MRRLTIAPTAAALLLGACAAPDIELPWHAVHLTWQGDTSTTMTINLVVEADGEGERLPQSASVAWRPLGTEDDAAASLAGLPVRIAGVDGVVIFRFELVDLEPGASYEFGTYVDGNRVGAERRFRTVPRDGPVRLATGGDLGVEPLSLALLTQAARESPDLLALGGDLSYANGLISNWPRWRTWLEYVNDGLVTPDGHTVPIVLAIGNHEVNVGRAGGVPESAPAKEKAPFYFGLFAQNQDRGTGREDGGATYFRRGLGSVGALYVLDSDHLATYADQGPWLADQLAADAGLSTRLALYHVPLYPAHRSYESSADGRAGWEEIFSNGRLTAALENHDHVFKRSHPLLNGKIVDTGDGVLYIGDGCMGRDARTVDLDQRWYLARSASEPHFWIAELSAEGAVFRALDEEGRLLDLVTTGDAAASPVDEGASRPELERIVDAPAGGVEFTPLWTGSTQPPYLLSGAVRNQTSYPMTAEITVAPPAGEVERGLLTEPAPPGAVVAFGGLFDGEAPEIHPDGSTVHYEFRFESDAGMSTARGRALLAPVELRSLARAAFPLADATAERWLEAGITPRSLDQPAEVRGESDDDPWQGPADTSAELYLAWDDEALYLRAEVTDDVVVGADEAAGSTLAEVEPKDVEAVLLFIDPWPERGRVLDDPQIAVGPGGSELDADPHAASSGEPPTGTVELDGSGAGYTAHVTVPWNWVTGAGAPERAALNVALVDGDGSPTVHKLFWFTSWENPRRPLGEGTFALDR